MGGGKGSSSSSVQMTPEQQALLKAQTDFLTGTAFPAYQKTVSGAESRLNALTPYVGEAAKQGFTRSGEISSALIDPSMKAMAGGAQTLSALFDPNYEQNQIQAALQAGREATREQLGQQNAMYGAAGGLGSSRQALADQNLAQLGAQRQAAAAAGAQAQVQQNRSAAAQALMNAGFQGVQGAQQAQAAQIQYANAPMDLYNKYASVVYGIPQQSTTANFQGTQGQTQRSKGFGF